jgi:Domain of unknown function (DUF1707)/Cell wall-active antibiotics response 4TMS YvqF
VAARSLTVGEAVNSLVIISTAVSPGEPVPTPDDVETEMTDPISDGDRHAVVARLEAAVEAGHLTLDEYGDRLATAIAARTRTELSPAVAGLPASESPPVIREHTSFGTIKHGGRWRLPARTEISTGAGSVKLDLRDAEVVGTNAEIAVRASVGTIKVWVPETWRVEVYGSSAIGGRYVEENHLPPDALAPTLRLRLDTAIGTVKVYRA